MWPKVVFITVSNDSFISCTSRPCVFLFDVPIIFNPSSSSSVLRLQAPPPSVHSGISVLEAQEALTRQQKQNCRVEETPPTYSEAIGHFYHPATLTSNQSHRTVSSLQAAPSSLIHGLLRPLPKQQGSAENRNTKEKSQKPEQVWLECFLFFPA